MANDKAVSMQIPAATPASRAAPIWYYRGLVLVTLIAAIFRYADLFANILEADEALFATWARLIALMRDPLLATQAVDKPPLAFYAQAIFYPLLGRPEAWIAHLPSLSASILLVPLTARTAWTIYGNRYVALIAALFLCLSPLAIRFSATAYVDPLLSLLIMASLLFAARGNHSNRDRGPAWSGVFFGLGAVTKHQAWLFAPLILAVGILRGWRKREVAQWFLGLLPWLLFMFLWDGVRGQQGTLWWMQASNFGGVRLAWSWELWERLEAWGGVLLYGLGSAVLAFVFLLALPLFLALLIDRQDWATLFDQTILVFVVSYFVLHWLLAIPVWDRYLLPLVPLIGLLIARFIDRVVGFITADLGLAQAGAIARAVAGMALAALMLSAAFDGSSATLANDVWAESDRGTAVLANEVAAAPYGTVLYDHWYSWQWRFHLLDTRVYVSWFPHPDALVDDLRAFAGSGDARYVALPIGNESNPVLRRVKEAGFSLSQVAAEGDIRLYKVLP